MSTPNPPLLGDEHGIHRIHLIGNSVATKKAFVLGTGKTTLGTYLSVKLNLPYLSLDELAWKPGWKKTANDEFKENAGIWMAQHSRGWIIDGNHIPVLGTLVSDGATDIIWLDPPLYYYLPRLLWRTLMRLLGLGSLCAEGCKETWSSVLSSEGIVWWSITNHSISRARYGTWLMQMGVDVGGKMRRLDESRGELTRWKGELDEHLKRP